MFRSDAETGLMLMMMEGGMFIEANTCVMNAHRIYLCGINV